MKKNECEAREVVTFKQVLGIQHTTSEILDIDTSERVDLSGVSTDLQGVWVRQVSDADIHEHIGQIVWRDRGAFVPVLRNTFLSPLPLE